MGNVKDYKVPNEPANFLDFLKKVNNKHVDLAKLAADYAYKSDCEECLFHQANECTERDTCAHYQISVIDYKAGFNAALRIVIRKNN